MSNILIFSASAAALALGAFAGFASSTPAKTVVEPATPNCCCGETCACVACQCTCSTNNCADASDCASACACAAGSCAE